MFRIACSLVVIGAAMSIPAVATAQTTATATPASTPEKKVCRRQEVTGSILGSRAICHTKAEWQKIDRANEDDAGSTLDRGREQQNSGVSNTRTGG